MYVWFVVNKEGGLPQRCQPCSYLGSEKNSDQCTYKHRYVGYIMSNDSSDNEDTKQIIDPCICMSELSYLEVSILR